MMMPISAEDCKRVWMVDKIRFAGIAAVFIALLLNSIVSISITGFSVSDTDPTTYIIVVMLMLFLFTIFYLKDKKLVPRPGSRNLLYGIVIFLVYFAVLACSRTWLSYLFMSYRIDALLTPLFLLSVIVAVFGFEGARRMKTMLIYSLFASPIILLPILNLNSQFALFNAYVIYDIARSVGLPLAQSGIVLTAPSSFSISISSACADIGAFVAFVMFVVPVAYLFDGSARGKLLWCISGVAVLFAMNIVRMFSLVLVWLFYGISSAASIFHIFAGEVLFSLAIVVMILIAHKFGLRIPIYRKEKGRVRARLHAHTYAYVFFPCIAFGLVGLALSLPYIGAVNVHPVQGNQTVSYAAMDRHVILALENSRLNVTQLPDINSTLSFALGSSSDPSAQTYVLVNYYPGLQYKEIAREGTTNTSSTVLDNGITVTSFVANYSNETFAVSYFSEPFDSGNGTFGITYEFVRKEGNGESYCSPGTGMVNRVESGLYDLLFMRGKGTLLCEAYLVANSVSPG